MIDSVLTNVTNARSEATQRHDSVGIKGLGCGLSQP